MNAILNLPKQREEILNGKLGDLLINLHPRWDENNLFVESTGVVRNHPEWKIDLLLVERGQPVAIEAKRSEGQVNTLGKEIRDRLGQKVDATGDLIDSGLAVVYPPGASVEKLYSSVFRFAAYQHDGQHVERWPVNETDWATGNVYDLAAAVEIISLSERRLRTGQQALGKGVSDLACFLERSPFGSTVTSSIATALHLSPGTQTTRIAMAILLNAFVFHYAIEDAPGIPSVARGKSRFVFSKEKTLQLWLDILKVNYWPIFSIAKEILSHIPTRLFNGLCGMIIEIAEQLVSVGVATFHDLTGRMLQRLIVDRKFLATFYTLPESAALLAEIATERLDVDWSDANAINALRIGDFACGTGALLWAVQRSIYRRHRLTGGNDADLHKDVMEQVLVGSDIMPVAAHLTASMLSSTHPGCIYSNSLVHVLPYGFDVETSSLLSRGDDTVYLGALDLLGNEFAPTVTYEPPVETGGKQMIGKQGHSGQLPVEHGSFDLVIMNPPFTRPNANRPADVDVSVPSFAGFDTAKIEQKLMSEKLKSYKRIFATGHAGLASNFMDLAHVKLKPGGILALVLPLTFTTGMSWQRAREALSHEYCDFDILTIGDTGLTNSAFSADTTISECLLIAKKNTQKHKGRRTVSYANLTRRPATVLEAYQIANDHMRGKGVREGSLLESGSARLKHRELTNVLESLRTGWLNLPRHKKIKVPVVALEALARFGLDSQMINGKNQNGPFKVVKECGINHAYPALWGHHATKNSSWERKLVLEPDAYGIVRDGQKDSALNIWKKTASKLHANRDFSLRTQSLAMATTQTEVIGGRAWPSIILVNEQHLEPILLWANSTLGLMSFWWIANRQQEGRSSITLKKLPRLFVLDPRSLSSYQFKQCRKIFQDISSQTFLPASQAHHDSVRQLLDRRLFELLNVPLKMLDCLDVVRLQWSEEPTV